jgi:hypothetical protein
MKLTILLSGTLICLTTFAQRPQIQEAKSVKVAPNDMSKKTPSKEFEKVEIKKNEPQFLEYKSPKETVDQSFEVKENNTVKEVPAVKYTDPNYEKNLAKSKEQEERMKATPTPLPQPESKEERLARYELELKKHPINSVEYNQISDKIKMLKSK